MKTETRQMGLQTRGASVSSVDAEKRTVELVWSTGASVKRGGLFSEPWNEELSMDAKHVRMGRLQSGAPLLNSHNQYGLNGVIGVVERATVDGKEGRATVRFSSRPEVEPIFRDVQDGIIRNVSVGYQVHKFEDVTEKGARMRTMRATDWEPTEISLVPVGADAAAGVRAGETAIDCEVVTQEVSENDSETRTEHGDASGRSADAARRSRMLRIAEAEL
jgi:hypothetical protein